MSSLHDDSALWRRVKCSTAMERHLMTATKAWRRSFALSWRARTPRHDVRSARYRALVLVVGLTGATLATHAHAATIINADAKSYTLTIVANDERSSATIAPDQSLDDVCPDGCIVSIEGKTDATYVLEGREQVTIQDGLLYWDRTLPTPETTE
ncbi:MAG: hypothetical protein AAGG99_01755 [Pseudomonadota bacterium]